MDQNEFKQSVRTEIMGPAVDALNEALRKRYAEMPERELTPMRPVRRDPDSDLMLDNRERASDMRGAR